MQKKLVKYRCPEHSLVAKPFRSPVLSLECALLLLLRQRRFYLCKAATEKEKSMMEDKLSPDGTRLGV
jgi:hypothetical protein